MVLSMLPKSPLCGRMLGIVETPEILDLHFKSHGVYSISLRVEQLQRRHLFT